MTDRLTGFSELSGTGGNFHIVYFFVFINHEECWHLKVFLTYDVHDLLFFVKRIWKFVNWDFVKVITFYISSGINQMD